VTLSWSGRRIDHELELAVVIGQEGYRIARADAQRHIAGYAIGLDMSIRGTEDRSFRKSLDSFTVLGPWLVSADELADCTDLALTLSVGGEVRQQSSTALLIWDIPKLIEYASSAYRLYPGDIILTGTPQGVAPVRPGDVMDCRIMGIGSMSVAVC
jgi:2-keto-4-pentenoate hydratase/2-oxohepta-3-ene-1,7-dioic acid hydratase in catechol pathway